MLGSYAFSRQQLHLFHDALQRGYDRRACDGTGDAAGTSVLTL
jgi:hypothetical protein